MALFIPGWKTSKNYIRSHDPRYSTDILEWASRVFERKRSNMHVTCMFVDLDHILRSKL